MKTSKFVKRLIIFLLILAALDRGLGWAFITMYDRLKCAGIGGMVNKAIRSKADVIVLGSSRAVHHFNSEVISDKLDKKVYNAGRDGTGLPYSLVMTQLIFQEANPGLVILEIEPSEILKGSYEKHLSRIANMAPYLDRSSKARDLLYSSSHWQRLKYSSYAFRFNSKLLYFIFDHIKKDKTSSGYVPLQKNTNVIDLNKASQEHFEESSYQVSEDAIDTLRQIVKLVKANNADIVLITSPRWFIDQVVPERYEQIAGLIEKIAKDEDAQYLMLSPGNIPVFGDPDMYADWSHLNGDGARIFSEIAADKILHFIK